MSGNREQQIAMVRTLYEVSGKGEWAAAEAMLTEDFFVTEAGTLPFAGTYRGRGALRELFTTVFGSVTVTGLEFKAMTQGDDTVIAVIELVLGPDNDRVQVAELFRFRGDKVCEIRPYYFDPAPMVAAAAAHKRAKA
ncbi:MAG: nuclear transport factor 2 family protein [Steroidobacteraceae bacterium]